MYPTKNQAPDNVDEAGDQPVPGSVPRCSFERAECPDTSANALVGGGEKLGTQVVHANVLFG